MHDEPACGGRRLRPGGQRSPLKLGGLLCLGALIVAPQIASALVVSSLRLRPARSTDRDSGRLQVRALLTASDAGPNLPGNLTSGAVSLSVTDGAAFDAAVVVTGCRASIGGRVFCRSDDGRVQARLKPAGEAPYLYELRVQARRLNQTATGQPLPTAPVKVTLRQPAPAERIGTVASCRQRTGNVVCEGTRRPNFIFIVTDDQRWDTVETMPHVQALAAQGVRFTNAFVPTPICAPSRASMLRGQYAHNTGVLTQDMDMAALDFVGSDASTFATWLQDAGYKTGMFGKYILGYWRQCPPFAPSCYVPPGWDEWHVFLNQGYFGYHLAENGPLIAYGSAETDYSTDVLAAKVVSFIESAHGQPFLVHLGTAAPHSDGYGLPVPAPRHGPLFSAISPWRPTSYDESDFADKPAWMQSLLPRATDVIGGLLTFGVWTDLFRRSQLASLAAVDDALAAIVSALDATGEADNTVIVLTSDNGFMWGEHRVFAGKVFGFDESIRVPLVISVPTTIGAPRNEDALVLSIDIAPTLAELAGVSPSSPVDGMSLGPLLRGETPSWREDFLIEYFLLDTPTYMGVRSEEWKYIEYPSTGDAELYDLVNDPYELENVSGDPAHAAIQATLETRLEALAGGD